MEDLMTSNVFGAFAYAPYDQGLARFLQGAQDTSGTRPLGNLNSVQANFLFWPQVQEAGCSFCEPDVLITLITESNERIMIMIESKYRSGKSSVEREEEIDPRAQKKIVDQLAKEWENLRERAVREHVESKYLVYVTADFGMPIEEIQESCHAFESKRPGLESPKILWLSWRVIRRLLQGASAKILRDLSEVMLIQRLLYFEGVGSVGSSNIYWKFGPASKAWKWNESSTLMVPWKFSMPQSIYQLDCSPPTISWRFDV
ncbi:MAG: hypothetical protein ACYCQJ_10875 [Nitrososphaerales archaeon]